VDVHGYPINFDEIPTEVVNAAYEFALAELTTPGTLTPTVDLMAREKSVTIGGTISVQYASVNISGDLGVKISKAVDLIKPLLVNSVNSTLVSEGVRS